MNKLGTIAIIMACFVFVLLTIMMSNSISADSQAADDCILRNVYLPEFTLVAKACDFSRKRTNHWKHINFYDQQRIIYLYEKEHGVIEDNK